MPELASRAHQKNIIPVIDQAIKKANINKPNFRCCVYKRAWFTWLLLVGVSFAKSFALAMNIPIIDVNHMQAHILAHFIKEIDGKVFS